MAATFEEKIAKCNHVLLDIEGTTTSITFVKDILFPYACEKASGFLSSQWEVEGVQESIEGMRLQADKDILNKVEGAVPIPDKDASKEDQIKGVVENLKWLISIDSKGTFMKKLSGLIWEQGYSNGELKGHVYNDVPPALESWQGLGKSIYIYSSGSVHAQKLLYKHSELGDLSTRIKGNYDTAVGHKQQVDSYKNIIKHIGSKPEETVFFTDIAKEAEAAEGAGLIVCLVVREGNAPLTEEDHSKYHIIKSFHEITFQTSSKRKQEDEEPRPSKVAKTEDEKSEVVEKTDEETVDKMDVDQAKEVVEETKSLETDETKPVETEQEKEKKTEEMESSDKEPLIESKETGTDEPMEQTKENEPVVFKEDDKVDDKKVEEKSNDQKEVEDGVKNDEVKEEKPVSEETKSEEKTESEVASVETADKTSTVENSETEKVEESSNENVSTAPTLVDEESKSSLDNINVDIAVDAEEEEKITDLLGAGEALDKECDDILSKVDQITSKDISVKPFIEKEIKDSILEDAMEVISESINNTDQTETKDTEDKKDNAQIDNGKTEEKEVNGSSTETVSKLEETIETKQDSQDKVDDEKTSEPKSTEKSENTNGGHLENGSSNTEKVNGKEGNGIEENGSKDEEKKESNGANGDSKTEVAESDAVKAKKVSSGEEPVQIEAET